MDSVAGAVAAERGGADRVELCDDLIEGGTTPSAGAIALTRRQVRLPLMVMIRPRGGDFLYTALELAVMRADLQVAKQVGADGVVFGCLTARGDVDLVRTRELARLARPLAVTFHRAFDMTRDPAAALEALIALGVDRVLTSGQEADSVRGRVLLAALQRQAAGRIVVMAGGGITPENVQEVVRETGIAEVHLSARAVVRSAMRYRNARPAMGSPGADEFSRKTTSERVVRALVRRLRGRRGARRGECGPRSHLRDSVPPSFPVAP